MDKLIKLQNLLQQELNRLDCTYTVIVRQQEDTQISIATFDKDNILETEGWYDTYDDFFNENVIYNFEKALTSIYLASLAKNKLWAEYTDKLRDIINTKVEN